MYECAACGFTFDLADKRRVSVRCWWTHTGCCFWRCGRRRWHGCGLGLTPRPGRRSSTAAFPRRAVRATRPRAAGSPYGSPEARANGTRPDASSTTDTRRRTPRMSPASSGPRCSPMCSHIWSRTTGNACSSTPLPRVAERSLRWVAVHTLHELVHHGSGHRRAAVAPEYADPPSVR